MSWVEQHVATILGILLVIVIPMIFGIVLHLDHNLMKICSDNVEAIKKLNKSTESNYTTNQKYVDALMTAIDEREGNFNADNAKIEWMKDGKVKIIFYRTFERGGETWYSEYTVAIPREQFKSNIFDALFEKVKKNGQE